MLRARTCRRGDTIKRKLITIEVSEQDLTCLEYMAQSHPKTMDAGIAMTLGSATMLIENIRAAWNKAPEPKKKKR